MSVEKAVEIWSFQRSCTALQRFEIGVEGLLVGSGIFVNCGDSIS